jgi:Tol biopolymer transport system component
MQYTRGLFLLTKPRAYRVSTLVALTVVVFIAVSDHGRGQPGPLWIGAWQCYEGGGEYQGTNPAFSHNGASVIYSTPATGHGDIYRYDRATKKNVRLTSDPEYDGSPSPSKDGKQIFFIREKENVGHFWVMDVDGSHQRQLTDGPRYDVVASFSKNGKTILLDRLDINSGFSHVWVMDADGSHQRQLTDGPWLDGPPLFAPDGSKVFFDRQFPRGPVPQRMGPVVGKDSLRWPEIYSMNVDGTNPRRLTHNLAYDAPLCFLPDGKRIFYCRADEYGKDPTFDWISIMDTDGSNPHDLSRAQEPAVSPDSRSIVFVTFGPAEGLPKPGLALVNADGTGGRTVYTSDAHPSKPAFAPDGSSVVFAEFPDEHGAGRIKILDLQTLKIEAVPKID